MFSPLRQICNKNTRNIVSYCCRNLMQCSSKPTLLSNTNKFIQVANGKEFNRFKSKGSKMKKEKSESETEKEEQTDDFFDNIPDKNTKTMKINTTSLRLDGVLKTGLGIARNKIEQLFYESKIRLNGEKVQKKSVTVSEGDEIDVIKGATVNNPNFITVARVEVLSITPNEENITMKIRRCKSLNVENYD